MNLDKEIRTTSEIAALIADAGGLSEAFLKFPGLIAIDQGDHIKVTFG